MGLPARIALPILAVFAVVFLGVMGLLLRSGLATPGAAFGPGATTTQGDARAGATPAPIATDPPGTFSVPQTGSGPVTQSQALPGNSTGGGPPPAVAAAIGNIRARLAKDPRDVGALVEFGGMESAVGKYDRALGYYDRALAVAPANGEALYGRAAALEGLGRRTDALAAYRRYLSSAGDAGTHADDARAAIAKLGG